MVCKFFRKKQKIRKKKCRKKGSQSVRIFSDFIFVFLCYLFGVVLFVCTIFFWSVDYKKSMKNRGSRNPKWERVQKTRSFFLKNKGVAANFRRFCMKDRLCSFCVV